MPFQPLNLIRNVASSFTVYAGKTCLMARTFEGAGVDFDLDSPLACVVWNNADNSPIEVYHYGTSDEALNHSILLAADFDTILLRVVGDNILGPESYQEVARANGLSLTSKGEGEWRCTLTLSEISLVYGESFSRADCIAQAEDMAYYDDRHHALLHWLNK